MASSVWSFFKFKINQTNGVIFVLDPYALRYVDQHVSQHSTNDVTLHNNPIGYRSKNMSTWQQQNNNFARIILTLRMDGGGKKPIQDWIGWEAIQSLKMAKCRMQVSQPWPNFTLKGQFKSGETENIPSRASRNLLLFLFHCHSLNLSHMFKALVLHS